MRRVLLSLSALALLALPVVAAEAPLSTPLPWLADPGTVAVDCGRASLDLAVSISIDPGSIHPVEGEPVRATRNCICPHAGPGWIMTGNSCVYDPGTALCSGECYWLDPVRNIGTGTPCGSP